MKTIAIAILLILFAGLAGAVTIPTPVYNAGHSGGDKFSGPVQVNDLIVDDDAQIGDDAAVLGDLAVTGAISAGAGTISAGVYDGDLRLAANHSFYSTTGSGGIDWSNATGVFKSPTGINTFGGIGLFSSDAYVVGNSSLNATTVTNGYASGTFGVAGISSLNGTTTTYLTDSGDASVGGDLGVTGLADLNATEATSIVNSGYSYLNGTSATSLYASTGFNAAGTSALNTTTATSLGVTNAATIGGTVTGEDLVVNNTTNLKQPIYYDTYACVTNTTISDSSIYSTFVIGNSTGYGQTMTLPTAAAAIGMTIKFIVDVEPDTNDIVIDGSGDETINGAATKTSSEQWAVLEVYCDGTEWYVTNSIGTWG